MRNYNMHSKKIIFVFISTFLFLTACNPLKEKPAIAPLVEIDYTDPELAQQSSLDPNHAIGGNLSLEIQEDLSTGKKTIYASASFYESTEKNVLFDNIPTKELTKNIYQPRPPPAVEPCTINGMPCPE
ncbi:MAG: hypothetical protein AABY53_06335 [Bdellovibrionota bacterium]